MRAHIEALEVAALDAGRPLRVTASFGVASLPENSLGHDGETLTAAAWAALQRSDGPQSGG